MMIRAIAGPLARMLLGAVSAGFLLLTQAAAAPAADHHAAARRALVAAIEENVRETSRYIGRDSMDPRVMAVIAEVPRHEFVPEDQRPFAYENRPLPIGYGQTISQPYIVALMLELLETEPGDPQQVPLPVGLQLMGRYGEDEALLDVGERIEALLAG